MPEISIYGQIFDQGLPKKGILTEELLLSILESGVIIYSEDIDEEQVISIIQNKQINKMIQYLFWITYCKKYRQKDELLLSDCRKLLAKEY